MDKTKIKYLSLPTRFELQPSNIDDRTRKLKIYVMHDLENENSSYFDIDVIESAKDSIKNVPVLAFIKTKDGTDEKDFAGHEIEMIINSDGINFRYLGRPIGVVPEVNNNYHYESIDGRNYAVVDTLLWDDYANEAIDILERDGKKSHSMEIKVDDGYYDEKADRYIITKYRYTGLVLLGDEYTPAMKNSHAELYSINYRDGYYEMLEELKTLVKYFTLNNGGDVKEKKNNIDNNLKDTIEGGFDVEHEIIEQTTEEVVEEQFDQEVEETEEVTEGTADEVVEETDEAVDEVTEVVEEVEVDFEVEKQEYENKINTLETKLNELQDKYSQLQSDYTILEQEKSELEQFQQAKLAEERKLAEDELFEVFAEKLTEEEITEVKDKASEMSLDEIETMLYVMVGKKTAKFTKRTKKVDETILPVEKSIMGDVKPGAKSYDHLMEKYAK